MGEKKHTHKDIFLKKKVVFPISTSVTDAMEGRSMQFIVYKKGFGLGEQGRWGL